MSESASPQVDDSYLSKVIEAAVRVGLVLLLLAWCFAIIRPFVTPVVWGIILAVAVYPAFQWLVARVGGRDKLAALIISLLGLALVILPALAFTGSLIESGQQIAETADLDSIEIPPPPSDVREWPVVGKPVYDIWAQASRSIEPLLVKFAPQLKEAALWLLGAGLGTGIAIAQSLLSIVIAGVMLSGASSGAAAAKSISTRLTGADGEHYVEMASATVRSVAVGIVGVAIIQAGLIGLGMVAVGVPHAAVWTLISLFLAVVQLPPLIVALPVAIYMFSHLSTPVAVVFLIWELLASASDSVLKPILLARGVEVPMLVIFLGAIGGFMRAGFIGLFIGAVVLSLGYELSLSWLNANAEVSDGDVA
jgi:predicted PurR-regulated permease PerM